MSQLLKAKTAEHGEIEIGIQQYDVGLYVCIYKSGRMIEQFGTPVTEEQFLAEIADILIE